VEGSVSTAARLIQGVHHSPEQEKSIRDNIWRCVEHMPLSAREPAGNSTSAWNRAAGWFETSAETIRFFQSTARRASQ